LASRSPRDAAHCESFAAAGAGLCSGAAAGSIDLPTAQSALSMLEVIGMGLTRSTASCCSPLSRNTKAARWGEYAGAALAEERTRLRRL